MQVTDKKDITKLGRESVESCTPRKCFITATDARCRSLFTQKSLKSNNIRVTYKHLKMNNDVFEVAVYYECLFLHIML